MKSTKWTKEDIKILTEYYADIDPDLFAVKDIAFILSRSEDAIVSKSRRLGLTDSKRKVSTAAKANMSDAQKQYFSNPENKKRMSEQAKDAIRKNGHPRGMKGKHHTAQTKAILAAKTAEVMRNISSEDEQNRIMKGLKTREKNGTLYPKRQNTTWKAGWREIGGYKKYYRSRWEANYARYLEWLRGTGAIKEWLHEPETFWFESIKRGVRSYLPDFKVTQDDGSIEYHEVKGWMDAKSATKLKRMAKYHPEIKMVLIQKKEYTEIAVKLGSIITGWEGK